MNSFETSFNETIFCLMFRLVCSIEKEAGFKRIHISSYNYVSVLCLQQKVNLKQKYLVKTCNSVVA